MLPKKTKAYLKQLFNARLFTLSTMHTRGPLIALILIHLTSSYGERGNYLYL